MISMVELAWVAGFLEGEGHFVWNNVVHGIRRGTKDTGKPYSNPGNIIIGANQAQLEPLQRVASLFGGNVTGPYVHKGKLGKKPLWFWRLTGKKAAGAMLTLWTFMSPRRRSQIEFAMKHWGHRKGEKRDD